MIPYAIAFAAAYAYMALHNPAMDHRIGTTLARFALGYVFVYYYVFVYVCCTLGLWLVFAVGETGQPDSRKRIAALLILSIGCGLLAGAYLDPAMLQARRLGRIARRSPHARHSVLVLVCRARRADRDVRRPERPGHAPRAACRHAGGLHDLCRRAHSRPWRRRHLQFDRLLSLCSPVLRRAVRHPAELAAARLVRLGQLLPLSLAHLHRHGAARSHLVASVRRYRRLCRLLRLDRPRSLPPRCWPSGSSPLPGSAAGWGPERCS